MSKIHTGKMTPQYFFQGKQCHYMELRHFQIQEKHWYCRTVLLPCIILADSVGCRFTISSWPHRKLAISRSIQLSGKLLILKFGNRYQVFPKAQVNKNQYAHKNTHKCIRNYTILYCDSFNWSVISSI